ncbi:MAG TPA: HlyD family efflux transporter periplasmic adaptor subunit, partial [Azospirillaceae bacterium]|nr:HlyD family efflux transporter periplasmic adaptor subunit [Azospirillaceae bacterium]
QLIVEARVSTRDIGFVTVDQPVKVKVHTFDFARYGSIPGRVRSLSATTFLDEQKTPYYKARVALERNHVGPAEARHLVLPGMTVEADINTGRKTVLQYLLKPIYTNLRESFRER